MSSEIRFTAEPLQLVWIKITPFVGNIIANWSIIELITRKSAESSTQKTGRQQEVCLREGSQLVFLLEQKTDWHF